MNICCKCKKTIPGNEYYGLHERCFLNWFNLSQFMEFSEMIPKSKSSLPPSQFENQDNMIKIESFFHGAFKKYSSRLDVNHYILKVVQEGHPELPITEFLCNQIYESLGIEIPSYYLIKFPSDKFCFVTKNFMTSHANSTLIHIYRFVQKNEYTCETLIKIIGEQTGRRIEQERFAFLTLADSLIGNHDRHGRNLGLIQSPKGLFLSPFYDNPSYIALDDDSMLGADLQPRGAIFTSKSNEPKISDYVQEWNRLGYNDVIHNFQKSFSLEKITQLITHSFLSEKRKIALIRLITKRGEELCDTIKSLE